MKRLLLLLSLLFTLPSCAQVIGNNAQIVTPSAGAVDSIYGLTGAVVPKVDQQDAVNFCADAGANDTYACDLSPAATAYVTGTHYRFKANTINTGAATINFNSLGAKTIVKVAGGITTALANADIRAGQWVDVVYDGTNMQMQSLLGNAASGTGDVVGPGSAVDNSVVLYDSTTGKLVKAGSGCTIVSGVITCSQFSGGSGADSGLAVFSGLTSGAVGLGAADIAGTAIVYVLPSTNGAAGQLLKDNGATTCPTYLAGSPATCHLLAWVSIVPSANGGTANGFTKFDGPTTSEKTFTLPDASATLTITVASGTKALDTDAIASEACDTLSTTTATGAASTDVLTITPNADITAVTGYAPETTGGLAVYYWLTTNTINWKICNPTADSITPGAVTLNYRITR